MQSELLSIPVRNEANLPDEDLYLFIVIWIVDMNVEWLFRGDIFKYVRNITKGLML